MTRPTIHDVAKVAGLSLATVDRVLNKRGGVANKSIQKVADAIAQTGYVRDIAAANLSRGREYRFAFVLPDSATSFMGLLRDALMAESNRLSAQKIRIDILTTQAFDTASLLTTLRTLTPATTDGIAMIAPETPEVQTEIARLAADGISVVSLVSDLPRTDRHAYVGPDNVAAGRTAATFMGKFIRADAGRVLVIAGSLAARDHMERVMGFRAVMNSRFPALDLLPAAQGFDDAATVRALVRDALSDGPLAGIYAVGAGNRGVLDALANQADRPVVIAHELTVVSRSALQSDDFDLVIDQNPTAEVRTAISIMQDLSDAQSVTPTQGAIPLNIFIRENIT
ncbi:LacI family DNA-binding transcriptional regulator [Yoonia sp. 208BN28-4]|uniref:LacI family DNA-binding transcriptional regulator n=1 Tax=Yoonia sp. 208BN28-4 TaxID=3126505 RepID=UPI0030EE7114